MTEIRIVDTWPVMEWLRLREPARTYFRALLDAASAGELQLHMSRINLGKVSYSVARRWSGQTEPYLLRVATLPITVISVDDALINEAAALKAVHSISYADCFAAALALRSDAPVITGDREFRKLADSGILKLHWLGA